MIFVLRDFLKILLISLLLLILLVFNLDKLVLYLFIKDDFISI